MLFNELHPEKVEPKLTPELLTEFGNVTDVKFAHPENALVISVKLDAPDKKSTLFKPVQVLKIPLILLGLNPDGKTTTFRFGLF
jgi:hypothetical protein